MTPFYECQNCKHPLPRPVQRRDKALCKWCKEYGIKPERPKHVGKPRPPKAGWLCKTCGGRKTFCPSRVCSICSERARAHRMGGGN